MKTLEQFIQEQFGGLLFLLCMKDAEIERLKDELRSKEQEKEKK